MKRLLTVATVVLLLAGFVAPVVELFDYWDPDGLEADTEFGLFALIFVQCLVLLVCRSISSGAFQFFLRAGEIGVIDGDRAVAAETKHTSIFAISPHPPLRI